jgi:carbon monoxide dehydrogenase subunit G
MASVSRTFTVKAPPSVAIPYLADFTNAEEWDPGTVKCLRQDSGPVKVGSTWQNTSKIAGLSTELTYTLEALTDTRVALVGRNKTATSTETIDVRADGSGSQITYVNDTVFNGAAKLAGPLVKLVFERLAVDVVKNLTERLNALAA